MGGNVDPTCCGCGAVDKISNAHPGNTGKEMKDVTCSCLTLSLEKFLDLCKRRKITNSYQSFPVVIREIFQVKDFRAIDAQVSSTTMWRNTPLPVVTVAVRRGGKHSFSHSSIIGKPTWQATASKNHGVGASNLAEHENGQVMPISSDVVVRHDSCMTFRAHSRWRQSWHENNCIKATLHGIHLGCAKFSTQTTQNGIQSGILVVFPKMQRSIRIISWKGETVLLANFHFKNKPCLIS